MRIRSKKTQKKLEKMIEALEEKYPKNSKMINLVGGFIAILVGQEILKVIFKKIK